MQQCPLFFATNLSTYFLLYCYIYARCQFCKQSNAAAVKASKGEETLKAINVGHLLIGQLRDLTYTWCFCVVLKIAVMAREGSFLALVCNRYLHLHFLQTCTFSFCKIYITSTFSECHIVVLWYVAVRGVLHAQGFYVLCNVRRRLHR